MIILWLNCLIALGLRIIIIDEERSTTRQNTRDPDALIEAFFALNKIDIPANIRNALYANIKKTCGEDDFKPRNPAVVLESNFTFTPEQRTVFILKHNDLIEQFCETFSIRRDQIVKE